MFFCGVFLFVFIVFNCITVSQSKKGDNNKFFFFFFLNLLSLFFIFFIKGGMEWGSDDNSLLI